MIYKQMIGLIAAMSHESDALLRLIEGAKRVAIGHFRAHSFNMSGQTFVLVTSGMGVRRARQATQALVEMYSLQRVISFGIAGAVEADLKIGDVILPEAFCQLEQGASGSLFPLANWPEAARQAAARALDRLGARLFTGTAVTTGRSQASTDQLGNIQHPVLEMETAGIAQVTEHLGIPLLSLRAISDGPAAPIPVDLGEVMDENANPRADRMIKTIIRDPRVILHSWQIIRNSRIAADNAAVALAAALRTASF